MTKIKQSPPRPVSASKLSRIRVFVSATVLVVLAFMWTSSPSSSAPSCGGYKIQYKLVDQKKANDPSNDHDFAYTRYAAYCNDDQPISIQTWTHSLARNAYQAEPLIDIIRTIPYKGVFWETKGCNPQNWETKPFEFVLVDAPQLADFAEANPNLEAFQEHFASCTSSSPYGCAFDNLGGTSRLIAPKPTTSQLPPINDETTTNNNFLKQYSHLAAFCRSARHDQVVQLFSLAAQEFEERMTSQVAILNQATWFSTAGMGVQWLHFRLDDRPKYYRFFPFAEEY